MIALLFVTAAGLATGEPAVATERQSDATLVLKVLDRDRAAKALIADAEKAGGFFLSNTAQQVVLRVPSAALPELIESAEKLGKVVDRTLSTRALTPELAQLRKTIASKRELLDKYFEVLDDATAEAVITVEQQINSLVTQIEQLSGRLRMLEYRAQLAQLTVQFQFRDRSPPPQGGSSFPWLNDIGLSRLYEEFER